MKRNRPVILVSYSGSSSENEGELPPLASHLMPAVPLDDLSKHQGRTLSTLHVEGQLAAYVYVPLALHGALRGTVERAVAMARQEVLSVHVPVLGASDADADSVAAACASSTYR